MIARKVKKADVHDSRTKKILNKTHGIAGCEKIVTALRTYAQGTGKQLKNPLFISILVILK
jgi:hypothetical protein